MWFLLSENKPVLWSMTSQPLSAGHVVTAQASPTQAHWLQGWDGQPPSPAPGCPHASSPQQLPGAETAALAAPASPLPSASWASSPTGAAGRHLLPRHHCVLPWSLSWALVVTALPPFSSQHPTAAQLPPKCRPVPVLPLPPSCTLPPTARLLGRCSGPPRSRPTRISDLASSHLRPKLLQGEARRLAHGLTEPAWAPPHRS